MTFIKYFLCTALIPLALFMAIGIYLEPLSGDLTRLGNVAEREWGWTAPQAVWAIKSNAVDAKADVIVIGDSFAIGNLWQSVAADMTGLTFVNYHWGDLGEDACLENGIALLTQRYPQARYVMMESIERAFIDRFTAPQQKTPRCKNPIVSTALPGGGFTSANRIPIASAGLLPDPIYALKALKGLIKQRSLSSGLTDLGNAAIAPLARDHLFSNQASGAILFLKEDLPKPGLSNAQLVLDSQQASEQASALAVKLTQRGLTPIFLVIPNKLTTYSPYIQAEILTDHGPDIWPYLAHSGVHSIALKEAFQSEAAQELDFYLPNDTHLSSNGFRFFGTIVGDYLNGLKGQNPHEFLR